MTACERFWKIKLASNKARDVLVRRTLQRSGWRVLRIWEHELARKRHPQLVRRLLRAFETATKDF
jgi:DNA mismatch endonuclease (patch repair protein)